MTPRRDGRTKTTTSGSPFGLALYGFGVGLALVGSIAGHVTLDRVYLWLAAVGLVALVVGLVMDVVAQRR